MNLNFSTSVPAAANNPSTDQNPMLVNNVSNAAIWDIDHYGFSNNSGGYHKIIHGPAQTIGGQASWNPVIGSGVPAAISATAIAGVNQVFAMNYTPNYAGAPTDTQLFAMTGAGGISQLTGASGTGDFGWAWIGAVLLIWGTASIGLSGTVTFSSLFAEAIPFPNACLNVQITPLGTNTTPVSIQVTSKNNTSFTWRFGNTSLPLGYTGFSFLAIGN